MSLRRVAAAVLLGISSHVAAENLGFKGEILYPQGDQFIVYQNDAILVRYNSEIPDNSIYTWCWDGEDIPTLKARVQDAKAYNSAELITINYTSSGDCWFNLKSNENPTYCGYNGSGFKVSSGKRATASTFGLNVASSTSSTASSSATSYSSSSEITSSPSTTTSSSQSSSTTRSERSGEITLQTSAESTISATSTTAATASGGHDDDSAISGDKSVSSGDGLGTAARIGLGVGIALGVIGIAALAIAFWMIRRRNIVVKSDACSDSEELQRDLPKHPWRTDVREMASNEELRRGPRHELPE